MKLAPATFPSSKQLQPIPTFVHPDISGNVNASTSPSQLVVPTSIQNNVPIPLPGAQSESSFVSFWPILLILVIVAAALFFFIKKALSDK